ncbi:MAG: PAS domain S-box protein [Spirochaetaceae bacterium]|nr:MAG: PAS domain S-box protein [Spirochaetaceae bacterium]
MASRILLVEDEPVIASSIARRLRHLGYEVVGSASSGDAALRLIDQSIPDLVLMDVKIEGRMDGVDTAGAVRDRFGIPVVFLTAYADESTLDRAKRQDPFGYLVKPFSDRELAGAIEIALNRAELERTVQQSEERYRMLSTVLSDYAFVIDVAAEPEDDVLEWSTGSLQSVFGVDVDPFSGVDSIAHLIHPDDAPRFADVWARVRVGARSSAEFRVLCGDGSQRWVKLDALAQKQRDRGTRVYGSFQDVTALRTLEQRLEDREFEFSQIVHRVQQGIWVADRDNLCVYANQAMCELTGYPREELVGKRSLESIIRGPTPDRLPQEVFETEVVARSGAAVPVLVTPHSVAGETGDYRGCFYLVVDISRQRHAAELIERGRRKLEQVFHESPAPSLLVDSASNAVVDVNTAFTEATGFAADEIIGTGGFGLAEYENLEDLNRMVMILKERSGGGTIRLKTRDGVHRLFTVGVRAIVVDDDELLMLILSDPESGQGQDQDTR